MEEGFSEDTGVDTFVSFAGDVADNRVDCNTDSCTFERIDNDSPPFRIFWSCSFSLTSLAFVFAHW